MKSLSKFAAALLLFALMFSIVPSAAAQPVQPQTAGCYWAQFVADVTVPDGTSFAPGAAFKKTWRIKNIGACAWTSPDVSLIFDSGEPMGAPASATLPTVNPGQTVDISVDLTAPSAAGHYFGYFKFKSASGGVFGIGSAANKAFWVEIYVNGSASAGYDFTANAASASWTSGAGALTFPGTDGSANGYALKRDNPKPESGVPAAQAGLVFAPNNITNGYIQAAYPAFLVQTGDRFQATIGCEYGATNCYVAYRLDYQINGGPVRTFWTWREKYEGLVYNVNLDLSSLAGQNVSFILVVSAYGSPLDDRALWINPIIARAGGVIYTVTPSGATPTFTPIPSNCDRAQFVADVTIPDGTLFQPGAAISKTWRLRNVGSCTWSNYNLMFDSGEKMGGPDVALIPTSVAPGQTVDITVNLVAPATAGSYRGYWKLKNSGGVPFGIGSSGAKSFWIDIRVTGTPVTPPTAVTPSTPVTPGTPIPGATYDFAANMCAAKWYSGAGELPCPGADNDPRGFVLVTAPSRLETGANDSHPGLITFPQNATNGYIQGIYPAYHVNPGDKFHSIINCEYGAASCYVVFRLDYSIAGSSTIQTFWAFVEKYEGQYYTADIDLTPLVGKDVKFILTVLSAGSAAGDRALWVAPMIYNTAGATRGEPMCTAVACTNGTLICPAGATCTNGCGLVCAPFTPTFTPAPAATTPPPPPTATATATP